jgi:proteasome lid subunit RPN8/RPN11
MEEDMARDLNRLMEDVRNAREVYVTEDGQVRDVEEGEREAREQAERGERPRTATKLKPVAFAGEGAVVRIAERVLDRMHEEANRFPGETGGIVVGPRPREITGLIVSGPEARRTSATYELDATYLQPLLDRAHAAGEGFLGVWHSHPRGCASLSSQDKRTAGTILGDTDWGVDEVLMPLSVRTAHGFETEVFLAAGKPAEIASVRTLVVSGIAPRKSEEHTARHIRVRRDRAEIEALGFEVATRSIEDGALLLSAKKGSRAVHFVLPEEYPTSPPEVLVDDGGQMQEIGPDVAPALALWSSRRSLTEILEAARGPRRTKARSRLRTRPPWLRAIVQRGGETLLQVANGW